MGSQGVRPTQVGVVGLGLMGSSIVVSLLASGCRVVALAPISGEKEKAAAHIGELLRHANAAGVLVCGIHSSIEALELTEDYQRLSACAIVLECVVENKDIKGAVYQRIAEAVGTDAVIASNTSAIPISELQKLVPHPERFLGIHWAEPAYMTRFLEVTCGDQTNPAVAQYVMQLGVAWGKEPTLLKKDIRGFITNRLMYAVYREALTLVEDGHTSLVDADKAFRYDAGSWITLMGVFQRMDFTGLSDNMEAFQRLFKVLNNREDVPAVMQRLVERNGKGIHNRIGLFEYTEEEANAWEAAFAHFNREIYELALRYNEKKLRKGHEKEEV